METYSLFDKQILSGDFFPVVDACYSREIDKFDMSPHYHNRVELMYVLSGECMVRIVDYVKKDRGITVTGEQQEEMHSGEFILIDQNVLHSLTVDGESYILNAEFSIWENGSGILNLADMANGSSDINTMIRSGKKYLLGKDLDSELVHILEQVIRQFSAARKENMTKADLLMGQMLVALSSMLAKVSATTRERSYVQKAKKYIDENISSEFCVEDIAREVSVAPAYLQRVFKQTTGDTLVGYIRTRRIGKAVNMLMYTDYSIMDIAVECGFNSRQHFFRVFKEIMGASPKEFRESRRTKQVGEVCIFGKKEEDHSFDIRTHQEAP